MCSAGILFLPGGGGLPLPELLLQVLWCLNAARPPPLQLTLQVIGAVCPVVPATASGAARSVVGHGHAVAGVGWEWKVVNMK